MLTARKRRIAALRRAVRRGEITPQEAREIAVGQRQRPATSTSTSPPHAAAPTEPPAEEVRCAPVLCRNPQTGELIWRVNGTCPAGWARAVADRLRGATRVVVERDAEGSLRPPQDGEEPLW